MRGVVIAVVMVVALGSACGASDDDSETSPVAPVTSLGTIDALAGHGLQMCSDLPDPAPIATTTTTMVSPTPLVSERDMSTTVVLLADTNPDVFAGSRWDGTTGQYVFHAVDVASAQTIIATGLPPDMPYRIERAPRSATEMRMLRDRAMMLPLDTVWSTGGRSWDGIVEISVSSVDDGTLTVIADAFVDDRDAICLRVDTMPDALGTMVPVGTPPPGVEQTTTTVGPTTTFDPKYLESVRASWALTGDWLIREPGVADGDVQGFAAFAVDPFDINRRFVSLGYGPCFFDGGQAIEADGLTQVVPIEDAASALVVECDAGPPPDAYTRIVECLETRCRLDVQGDVMRVSTDAGEHIADLIRATDGIPPT